VEVGEAAVEGDDVAGFVVAAEEPHPSATIPAIEISVSRIIALMAPSSHSIEMVTASLSDTRVIHTPACAVAGQATTASTRWIGLADHLISEEPASRS